VWLGGPLDPVVDVGLACCWVLRGYRWLVVLSLAVSGLDHLTSCARCVVCVGVVVVVVGWGVVVC